MWISSTLYLLLCHDQETCHHDLTNCYCHLLFVVVWWLRMTLVFSFMLEVFFIWLSEFVKVNHHPSLPNRPAMPMMFPGISALIQHSNWYFRQVAYALFRPDFHGPDSGLIEHLLDTCIEHSKNYLVISNCVSYVCKTVVSLYVMVSYLCINKVGNSCMT
jgi:hypothetical protein